MNEKKIHTDFINDPPPFEYPAADEAWTEMKNKLDKEEKEKPLPVWWYFAAVFVFLLILTGLWILNHDTSGSHILPVERVARADAKPVTLETPDNSFNKKSTSIEKTNAESINDSINKIANTSLKKLPKQAAIPKQTIVISSKKRREDAGKQYSSKTKFRHESSPSSEHVNEPKKEQHSTIDTAPEAKTGDIIAKVNADTISKSIIDNNKKEETPVAESKEENITNYRTIQAGLQWNAQIPFNSGVAYFAGTNGSSQPYRILFPGFWLGMQADRNMLTVHVNPFASAALADKPYETVNTISGSDIIVEKRTLHKVFGTSAGLDYDYNIKNRWWIGGNLLANLWRSGTATAQGEKTDASTAATSVIYKNKYSLSDSAWNGFTKFQAGLGWQVSYKQPVWMAGIRMNYFIAPLIDKDGQRNRINAQLFVRWTLYRERK